MAIKVKVNVPDKCVPYPKLMQSLYDGAVVLFTQPMSGTAVYLPSSDLEGVGYISSTWDMQSFIDFDGTVELSNE